MRRPLHRVGLFEGMEANCSDLSISVGVSSERGTWRVVSKRANAKLCEARDALTWLDGWFGA